MELEQIQAVLPGCCEADALPLSALSADERRKLECFSPGFQSVIVLAHHVRHGLEWAWYPFDASPAGVVAPADLHLQRECDRVMAVLEAAGSAFLRSPIRADAASGLKIWQIRPDWGAWEIILCSLHREWGPWGSFAGAADRWGGWACSVPLRRCLSSLRCLLRKPARRGAIREENFFGHRLQRLAGGAGKKRLRPMYLNVRPAPVPVLLEKHRLRVRIDSVFKEQGAEPFGRTPF